MCNTSMKRNWAEEAAQTWIRLRDEHLKQRQVTAMTVAELRASEDPADKTTLQGILTKERSVLTDRVESFTKNTLAWQIQKHPPNTYLASASGVLHLPLNLREIHGTAQIKFEEGDNLNHLVYKFFDGQAPSSHPGPNYVTQDSLSPKRHEYLGPAPHVVDYQFSGNGRDCYIEWWDSYLNEKWVGNQHWANEVYFDQTVYGWVLRRRGRFGILIDDNYYCGCSGD